MVKFGRISGLIHQQCFNHCIHLSVCDVLYEKKTGKENSEENSDGEVSSEEDASDDEDNGQDEDANQNLNDNFWIENEDPDEHNVANVNSDFRKIINGVRKDARKFRKSAKKKEKLLNHT